MSTHGGLLLQPVALPPPAWPAVLARWRPDAGMLIVLVLAGVLYLTGVRQLHRRGGRWPAGRTVAYLAGLVVIAVVTFGPPAFYGPVLFSSGAAVHMSLMWVAPAPLAFGRPVTLALRAGPPRLRRALRGVLRSRTNGDRLATLGYLSGLHRTWGPAPLLDQDYGGSVIAWVGNAMCYLYGLLLLILWIRHDRTRTRHKDREHDSLVAAGRESETELAGYNAWLAALERAERPRP